MADPLLGTRALAALLARAKAAQAAPVPLNTPVQPVPPIPLDPLANAFKGAPGAPNPSLMANQNMMQSPGISTPNQPPLPPPPFMGASQNMMQSPGISTPNQATPVSPQAPQPGDMTAATTPASDTTNTPDQSHQFDGSRKTDSFGSWFNKPSSSDAMSAFGAAMLKAPTFLQGLGDATAAVNQVDQNYRMPSPQEIAKAKMKAEMTAYAYGLRPQKMYTSGQSLWTSDGVWQSTMNKQTGQDEWQGPHGERQPNPPEGGVPFAGTGMLQSVKAGAADESALFQKSQAAQVQLPTLDREISLLKMGKTGVGTDAISQLKRSIVTATGVSFGGTEPKDMNELTKLFANGLLESAQGQKGLGALSDGERALIEKANASSGSNPDAILELLQVQKQRLQRVTAMQDAWDNEKAANGATTASYRHFANNFTEQWDKAHALTWGGSAPPASGGKSILDAADAIVGK